MITDEKVMTLVQERQVERYKNGEKNPRILYDVLNYIEKNNDISLIDFIVGNDEKSSRIGDFLKGNTSYAEVLEDKLVNIIIKSGCAKHIYYFAKFVRGIKKNYDISALEDAMCKSGSAKYIYFFAVDIKGANISKLEKAILETKDMKYISMFARYISGVSLEFLKEVMNNLEKTDYILETKIKKLEEKQSILQKQASENVISYATKIISGDRKKALDELIDEGNMLKLKIYGEFLTAPEVTMEEAYELDKEYTKTKKMGNRKTNNE